MHTPFEVVGPGMAAGVPTHPFTLPTRLILLLPSCPQLAPIVARSEFPLKGAVQGGGGCPPDPAPWGAECSRGAENFFGAIVRANIKKKPPANNNCHTEFHNGTAAEQGMEYRVPPPPPLSCPTPRKTVPHHPLGDGCPVTVPKPPLGNHTTTVHSHFQAQKVHCKTREFNIRCVQRAANVLRPNP